MSEQNIYDNSVFFDGYKTLRDKDQGFNCVIEQPILRSLLPILTNKIICDLGCGFGDFCRYSAERGAKKVIGVDISKKMLDEANNRGLGKNISYINKSIEKIDFETNSLDLVVSSLSLHYVKDIELIFNKIRLWLKQGGEFTFTVEHPICTSNPSGETVEINNELYWVIKNYSDEASFNQSWFVDNVIKYHRKVSTYINLLIKAGFQIEKMFEPTLDDNLIINNEKLKIHKLRPPLLAVKAKT